MTEKFKPIRDRGSIEELPSGSLRVTVYAGTDKRTGARNNLTETVQVPKNAAVKTRREAWKRAEQIKQGFIAQVDARRHPRTNATVNELLDKYLELPPAQRKRKVEPETIEDDKARARNHIRPIIGDVKIADLDAEIFDSFYGELLRCRRHCRRGERLVDHRTALLHECDDRCKAHQCRPLADDTVRRIHTVLSGALTRAVRWKWLAVNPIALADPPAAPPPDPNPPTSEEIGRLINAAWHSDPEWGLLIWMAVRTGARRGEICAWSWDRLDLDVGVLRIETAISESDDGQMREKDTKTHRKRRVALTEFDIQLLRAYRNHRERQAEALGATIAPNGRIFSPDPDCASWHRPSTLTQRFGRLRDRLGIKATLKETRHFAATELIAAGVDVRTVAGILGHGGGGTTTLRVYAAHRSESAQRAADLTGMRMPSIPAAARQMLTAEPAPVVPEEPTEPYEHIARDLLGAIRAGIIASGDRLPPQKALAERYEVAPSTAHRALQLLIDDGLVRAARGVPACVVDDVDSHLKKILL
ncbi:tyrosine-type recombinase/integrase [Glycomyces buryatensis]|nr:tyrosine-type recombinase/integrase [Glycomyces buryatensis]